MRQTPDQWKVVRGDSGALSATKIGGAMLAVGAALGIVMRFLRPGEIVIDYLPSDATLVDRVRVLADNATLTHVTSLFGALGLLMLLTFAVFGFAAANGLNHVIAHVINHGAERGTDLRTLIAHAIDIQTVKAGILIIAGYGYVLGFAGVSLGLSLRFPSGLYRGILPRSSSWWPLLRWRCSLSGTISTI